MKASSDVLVARAIMSGSAALLLAPVIPFVPWPDGDTWVLLAISVPIHAAYQFCLIRALQRGDLSLVFPVMRGLAPVLTACGAFLVLDETLSLLSISGLVIASLAVLSFAWLQSRAKGDHALTDPTALVWAGATALGVMAYNVADARGIRLAIDPFTFIVWLFVLDSVAVGVGAVLMRRGTLAAALRLNWRHGFIAGGLSILSYGSSLYAFRLTQAAHVAALRETAVIFGALMGWLFLKEGLGPRRLVAASVLVAGLGLMQFGM